MNTARNRYLEQVKRIVLGHLQGRDVAVYLFGSHAAGTARRYSDVDVAIDARFPIPASVWAALSEGLPYAGAAGPGGAMVDHIGSRGARHAAGPPTRYQVARAIGAFSVSVPRAGGRRSISRSRLRAGITMSPPASCRPDPIARRDWRGARWPRR